jgi:hypothetical protein
MLFLRAAEDEGVDMPKTAFNVAKMIDGMLVQQKEFGLPPVVDECIEEFVRRNMTWAETTQILYKGVKHSLQGSPAPPSGPGGAGSTRRRAPVAAAGAAAAETRAR